MLRKTGSERKFGFDAFLGLKEEALVESMTGI
jgi:hypothetical protein